MSTAMHTDCTVDFSSLHPVTCCTFVQALVSEGDGSVEFMIVSINPHVLNVDIKYSATSIYNIGTLPFFGIMAGWHYGEGSDSGLWNM